MPALSSTLLTARVGAIPKSTGYTAPSVQSRIRAIGFNPRLLAACSDIKSNAQAPSLILLELAVVIVPFFANKGRSLENCSGANRSTS